MAQALYRKHRPKRWEDVVGQEHVITTLRNAVIANRVAHAQLFAGPRGTGKTTAARILAKAVNCLEPDAAKRPCNECEPCKAVDQGRFMDLIEIDAASNTSVEDVRDLRDKIGFSPTTGRYKVYIIDEVHMLSTAAFNALLKTLEEPPAHAMFILATTEMHKIPATVLSRCQHHEFRRIPIQEIVDCLVKVAEKEDIQIEPEALSLVARQAAGGMRDAISLLDQLASMGGQITLGMAQTVLGTATNQSVIDLIDTLITKDAASGLECIHRTLDAGSDPRQFARQVVDYLRSVLLVKMQGGERVETTPEMRLQMTGHAQAIEVPALVRYMQLFDQAASEGRAWMPALPLELALVQALEASPSPAAPASQPESNPPVPVEARPRVQRQTPPPAPVEARPAPVPEPDREAGDPQSNRRLEEHWKQILELTRQSDAGIYGLLNSTKSRTLGGGILTLGFSTDVLRQRMEKAGSLELVQKILQQVFGAEIEVRCITISGKRTTPPPGVDSDGMVASALRDLGGEIVDIH
jgi:DNA polymerase-3 subunit gamma/tau